MLSMRGEASMSDRCPTTRRAFGGRIASVNTGVLACVAALVTLAACDRTARDTSADTTSGSKPAAADSSSIAAYRDTLLRLGREDQAGREGAAQAFAANDTVVIGRMLRGDSARTAWLREFVKRNGWPRRSQYGDTAAKSAWLILQHSQSLDFQEEMLPTLEELAVTGEVRRQDVALLADRVMSDRGKPQRYGSQFGLKDGKLVLKPVVNLDSLDAWRATVGLPPMAEYVKVMSEMYKMPVVWPPKP
jgi:hypothetical protein